MGINETIIRNTLTRSFLVDAVHLGHTRRYNRLGSVIISHCFCPVWDPPLTDNRFLQICFARGFMARAHEATDDLQEIIRVGVALVMRLFKSRSQKSELGHVSWIYIHDPPINKSASRGVRHR